MGQRVNQFAGASSTFLELDATLKTCAMSSDSKSCSLWRPSRFLLSLTSFVPMQISGTSKTLASVFTLHASGQPTKALRSSCFRAIRRTAAFLESVARRCVSVPVRSLRLTHPVP